MKKAFPAGFSPPENRFYLLKGEIIDGKNGF